MDPGTFIATAVTSVRGLTDIARGLKSLKNLSDIQPVAVELYEQIITIQQHLSDANSAMSAQVERIRDLEVQIARMNEWQAHKLRYKLAAPFPGCMVYAVQKSMADGEPAHYLCAACYQNGVRSILQGRDRFAAGANALYVCPARNCGAVATTTWGGIQPPKYFEDITASG
jgi:CII-binding regulator of phage lambda lysogenization HflD